MTDHPDWQAPPRVLIVNPPFLPNYSRGQRSPAVTRSGTLYYPMWLAYLAGFLEQRGVEVCLIDAPAEGYDEAGVLARARGFSPSLIVVEAATPSADNDFAIACRLRRGVGRPTLLVGPHVSALPDETLRAAPEVDAVVVGEYELPVGDYLDALLGRRSPEAIDGIAYRGLRRQPRAAYVEDLDALPFVSAVYARQLTVRQYFNPNAHHPMVALVSGRGCPRHCSFCVYPQTLLGHRFRRRSVANVVAELDFITQHLPDVKGVFFEDDTFTHDPAWVAEFAEVVARRGYGFTFTANARPDLDLALLGPLKAAGFRALCVGFESGNQELLDRVGKGTRVADFARFATAARDAGIRVHGCFIVGLPGETRRSMRQTLQLALTLPLDTAQFYPLMVYPGTRAFDELSHAGLVVKKVWRDWLTPEGHHACVVRTPTISDEALTRFCNLARRRFYLRKSYLREMVWRVAHDPNERWRAWLAARTFVGHLLRDRV